MISLSFCWSFHHLLDEAITQYMTPCDSRFSRYGWYRCWVLMMVFSRELGESSSRTRMKDAAGIIITSWLLSFPLSDLNGRDRASAAVWSHLGVCWSSK